MGFDPMAITQGPERQARKIVLYGPPKLGKSTLAISAKNSLLLPTENRVAHLHGAKLPLVTCYEDVETVIGLFKNGTYKQKRFIIDTLDEFEPLLHDKVSREHGWNSLVEDKIKDTNFNKGLSIHAVIKWRKFLAELDDLRINYGIDIILVAHAMPMKVNPPDHDQYDKWAMKIDKYAVPILEGWADIIAFYDKEIFVSKGEKDKTGKPIAGDGRKLYVEGKSPAMISCNCFGLTDVVVQEEYCADIMEWLLTGPYEEKVQTNEKKIKKGE